MIWVSSKKKKKENRCGLADIKRQKIALLRKDLYPSRAKPHGIRKIKWNREFQGFPTNPYIKIKYKYKKQTLYKLLLRYLIFKRKQPSQLGLENIPTASLQRGKNPFFNECPEYNTKRFNGEAPLMLELLWMQSTSSLPSHPGPLWNDSTWLCLIYGSKRYIWHLNCVQTNDLWLIDLFEIELFDHLSVCKEMTDV